MNPHHHPRVMLRGTLLILGVLIAPLAQSDEPKKKADTTGTASPLKDANLLSMEVNALRTLYLLRGSEDDQSVGSQNPTGRLNVIKNQFASCAPAEDKKREPADVSDGFRKVLTDLRAALIAEDKDRVADLDKQLRDLQKEEDPDLDDHVEITEEARQKAGNFVRLHCSADQVVTYLASYGKDLPNPRTLLFKAMRLQSKGVSGKKPSPEEWKEIRAFAIREVTWQIGGLNVGKGDQIGKQVGELLDKAYAMSYEDLKNNAKAQELRAEARKIIDRVGPTDLIRHVIEQDVAEMLSNPRLVPAVKARLEYLRTKNK